VGVAVIHALKEADSLYLVAELLRTGSPTLPWVEEVLRSADLNRMERTELLEKLLRLASRTCSAPADGSNDGR
jgi:hypothetical protein